MDFWIVYHNNSSSGQYYFHIETCPLIYTAIDWFLYEYSIDQIWITGIYCEDRITNYSSKIIVDILQWLPVYIIVSATD